VLRDSAASPFGRSAHSRKARKCHLVVIQRWRCLRLLAQVPEDMVMTPEREHCAIPGSIDCTNHAACEKIIEVHPHQPERG
jgi:hypothetical protein